MFKMAWEYFSLKDSVLVDDNGDRVLDAGVRFDSVEQAEQYLIDNDIRGSVRSEPYHKR